MVNKKKIILTNEDKKRIEDLVNFKVKCGKEIVIDNVSYNPEDSMVSVLIKSGRKYISINITNNGEYIIDGALHSKMHKTLEKEDMYSTIVIMSLALCLSHKY